MTRFLLIVFSMLVPFMSSSFAQEQDNRSPKCLHFQLISDHNTFRLLPVEPETPIVEGETRISCREIEVSAWQNKPKAVLLDVRIDNVDSWMEGERVTIEFGPQGLTLSGAGLTQRFKTVEAEQQFATNSWLRGQALSKESIDRGMIESEKEHRKLVLQQLRRTFITGQSQIPK